MEETPPQRLGRRELGAYAFEEHMPARISRILEADGLHNDEHDVIPTLARMIVRKRFRSAYLCYDQAVQIHRLAREGNNFCGYRNLQMLCLALGSAGSQAELQARLTIADLQQMIETAWKSGFNAKAMLETGGISGSRKHIGSPEVEAVLQSLDIPYDGHAFIGKDAAKKLFDFVEAYFSESISPSDSSVVQVTRKLPLFLQRPQHSLTVVGITTAASGKRTLLVFDPAMPKPPGLRLEMQSRILRRMSDLIDLALYSRSESYLSHYTAFEMVSVRHSAPAVHDPAADTSHDDMHKLKQEPT